MEPRRKQMHLRQKAYFEQKLKERLFFLSRKDIEPRQADKDPIAKKLKADIKAVNYRLKRIEDMAKVKVDRAAALLKEKEGAKAEKDKKTPEEGKEKKPKPEKKAAPAEAPEEGKAPRLE